MILMSFRVNGKRILNLNKIETVFKKNHYEWKYQNNVFNLEDNEVYCLQIIHNRNLINTLIGKLVVDNHLGEKFGNNFNIISFNYFETLKIRSQTNVK